MQIQFIRTFKDNYVWLFLDDNQLVWIVDPGEALPIQHFLQKHKLTLGGVLLTHHHYDHSGGIAELIKNNKGLKVFASKNSTLNFITDYVQEGDEVRCGAFEFKVIEIPGHTLDHLAFFNNEVIFTGDTLFSMGCGKVFEGSYLQMYHSLEKLKKLSSHLKVYCGHEYTAKNLSFAQLVDPDNHLISNYQSQVKSRLLKEQSSLPSILGAEIELNPFLRCDEPQIIKAVKNYSKVDVNQPHLVFEQLRKWKDLIA